MQTEQCGQVWIGSVYIKWHSRYGCWKFSCSLRHSTLKRQGAPNTWNILANSNPSTISAHDKYVLNQFCCKPVRFLCLAKHGNKSFRCASRYKLKSASCLQLEAKFAIACCKDLYHQCNQVVSPNRFIYYMQTVALQVAFGYRFTLSFSSVPVPVKL